MPFSHHLKYLILSGSITLYGIIVLLDPTNSIVHLKTPAFALCLSCWLLFSNRNVDIKYYSIILITWLFLTYGMVMSEIIIQPIDVGYKSQIANLFFLTLLILPINALNSTQIFSLIFRVGLILAIVIWILYLIYVYSGYGQAMYLYFTETANLTVMIAKRTTLGIEMTMFFHKAVPYLLLPLAYVLTSFDRIKRIVYICLLIFPIGIGGSRTPILCAVLLIGIFCYLNSNSQKLKNILMFVFGCGFIYFLVNIIIEAQGANELKFDSYDSYVNTLLGNFKNFAFGRGIGSLIHIPTRGNMAYSELSIMDLFNQYGFIIGCFFLIFLVYPGLYLAMAINKKLKFFGCAYLLYMVISATNPLLFSSTGWFIWALMSVLTIKGIKHNIRNKSNDFSLYCRI